MKPEEFISNIKTEIDSLVSLYSEGKTGQTDIGIRLEELGLEDDQKEIVLLLIKQAIQESTYNLVCALEGAASLAGSQETYKITDESGNVLSGELDDLFYEQVME